MPFLESLLEPRFHFGHRPVLLHSYVDKKAGSGLVDLFRALTIKDQSKEVQTSCTSSHAAKADEVNNHTIILSICSAKKKFLCAFFAYFKSTTTSYAA